MCMDRDMLNGRSLRLFEKRYPVSNEEQGDRATMYSPTVTPADPEPGIP